MAHSPPLPERKHCDLDKESSNEATSPTQDANSDSHFQRGDDQPEFPEGSLRGWLTVCGGAMIGICTMGNVQTFGVYQDFYTRTYLPEHTPSQISWIGSLQLCLLYCLGPFSGKLFDAGYFHHLMIVGSTLFLFSSFMLSLVKPHQYYQAMLAQGVGMGIGAGMIFLPSLSIVSHYFRARRSVGMGIVVTGGAFGAVIYPIILNRIFNGPLGFGWGVRFVAFIDLVLLVLANLFMRTRIPPRRKIVDLKQILTDGPYWLLVIGLFLGFWGIFFPFFYLQLFAKLQGVSPQFLTYTIPLMNAGSVFGRFLPNFLSDRYGPLNIMIPCGLISSGLVWALLSVSTISGVTVFGVLYGFFSGGFLTLASPALASFSSSPGLGDMGLRIGIASFFIGIALLTGNPIGGALLHPPEHFWWRPLAFACITTSVGTLCIIISRQSMVRRKRRAFV